MAPEEHHDRHIINIMSSTPLYQKIPANVYYLLAFLPVATASLAVYTIFTCATLTFEANVLPKELRFPPISLFGVRPGSPEQILYFWGFPAVAALFLVSTVPISSYLMANVEKDSEDGAWKASWTSSVAFLGLAIHGMVPLHPDILEMIHGREQSGDGMAQSAIHQLAAAMFFMLSMYHGFVVCNLLWSTEKLPTGWKNSGIVGKFSFVVKSLTLAMQLLPAMTGLLYHPATLYILGIKGTLNESDQGGLAQWWTVGCLIFFYLTYSLDLVLIGSHLNSSVSVDIKKNN